MTHKLSQLDRDGVFPKNDMITPEGKYAFDKAIDAVNQLNVVWDVEALAKTMCNFANSNNDSPELINIYPTWDNATDEIKDYYLECATAILASMPQWCSLKKGG